MRSGLFWKASSMMDTEQQPWTVVVEPTTRPDAALQFEAWRHANPLWASQLADADIEVDTMRALDGRTLERYRVRAIALPQR